MSRISKNVFDAVEAVKSGMSPGDAANEHGIHVVSLYRQMAKLGVVSQHGKRNRSDDPAARMTMSARLSGLQQEVYDLKNDVAAIKARLFKTPAADDII